MMFDSLIKIMLPLKICFLLKLAITFLYPYCSPNYSSEPVSEICPDEELKSSRTHESDLCKPF